MIHAKVTVSKEVAEAIEYLRNEDGYSFAEFMNVKTRHQWSVTTQGIPLNHISTETLATALINGYEVEKTSEEKVREYYESLEMRSREADEAHGVEETLNLLGIKIEGVNA